MPETFDTDAILKDVLEVLHKHGLPVQTAALNISLLDDDFEAAIPDLISYKAGVFYRPKLIDGVPMLFEAKRRIPFDDLLKWLEQEIAPQTEQFAQEIQREFPQFTTTFETKRTQDRVNPSYADHYHISVETRLSDAEHEDYNVLQLSISLRLRDLPHYPLIQAYVGWLVDEEGFGDWGVEMLNQRFFENQEALWHIFEILKTGLSSLFASFRKALQKAAARPE